MDIICPHCDTQLGVESGKEGVVDCPECSEKIDVSAILTAVCSICGCAFEETDEIRICPNCKSPYHEDCWQENRGCATYGCGSTVHQQVHVAEEPQSGQNGGAGMIPCPACGAMHPASDLVCASCGKLLGDGLPKESVMSRIKKVAGQGLATAKVGVLPDLARNMRLLGGDAVGGICIWWKEFLRIFDYKGKTGRRDFLLFAFITFLIMAVLFMLFHTSPAGLGAMEAVFLLSFGAVCVRRLRDTAITPYMIFALPLLPLLLLVPSVVQKEGEK